MLDPQPRDFRARHLLATATILVGWLAPEVVAQGQLTGVSERFAMLQPSRSKTFIKASSDPDDRITSPARGNDDGFSGVNGTEAYRRLTPLGDAAVLADIQGRSGFMGLFFRNFWTGAVGAPLLPIEDNQTQILVDDVLAFDQPLSHYFRNVWDPLGQVEPFHGPFTGNRAGAHVTHSPIFFERSLQLRLIENVFSNAGRFHKVAWTVADPEGNIDVPDLAGWEDVLARRGGWRHQVARSANTQRMDVPAGGSRRVLLAGAGAILEFRVRVDRLVAWEHLDLRIRFDGQSSVGVDLPLRMLGSAGALPYHRAVDSVLHGNDGLNEIWCYFPMPFAESASIEIRNRGTSEQGLDLTLATWQGRYPEPWGYFTATWNHGITQTGVPFRGPQFTNCRGVVRALVLEDIVDSTGRIAGLTDFAHLEGDLCVRINGLRGDENTFAASETSIGKWGWYLTPSDVFFEQDGSFNTGFVVGFPTVTTIGAARRQGSTLITDPIQFASGLDIVLEHGIANTSNAEYGFTTFSYVQPGAARAAVAEIDVGDPASEAAVQAQFGVAPITNVVTTFFRDNYFGNPPLADEVRTVQDFYRFQLAGPALANQSALGLGFRLDRMRTGSGGVMQARVFVDGYFAGLLHSFTTNPVEHWKEGGECEVELPKALTRGKATITVEVRPVPGTEPLRIGTITVYGYNRD